MTLAGIILSAANLRLVKQIFINTWIFILKSRYKLWLCQLWFLNSLIQSTVGVSWPLLDLSSSKLFTLTLEPNLPLLFLSVIIVNFWLKLCCFWQRHCTLSPGSFCSLITSIHPCTAIFFLYWSKKSEWALNDPTAFIGSDWNELSKVRTHRAILSVDETSHHKQEKKKCLLVRFCTVLQRQPPRRHVNSP